jgi:hypothetical protein
VAGSVSKAEFMRQSPKGLRFYRAPGESLHRRKILILLTGLLLLEQHLPSCGHGSRKSDSTNPLLFRRMTSVRAYRSRVFLIEPGGCIRGHWYEDYVRVSR